MTNYKSIVGVTVATALLLSACIGRQGVVGQEGVAGQQVLGGQNTGAAQGGLAGQQILGGQSAGGQQRLGSQRRGLFGQQVKKPKNEEPVSVKKPEKTITAKERFAGTVAAHNSVRTKKGLAGLIWSDTLASYSQQWADHLAKVNNCALNHRPTSGELKQKYGENLWRVGADVWSDGERKLQKTTIESVVSNWAKQAGSYNYETSSCAPGKKCNSYTQIVWQATTSVGCGYQQCSDKSQIWVCNYNPPGNFTGKKPY